MTNPYISQAVERSLRGLESRDEVELALVVESGTRDHLEEVNSIAVDGELPSGVLLITVPAGEFDSLTAIPGVRSVSLRDQTEIMQ